MSVSETSAGPLGWVDAAVTWRDLVAIVCDIAEAERVKDGHFSEDDADRLAGAAAIVRMRAMKATAKAKEVAR